MLIFNVPDKQQLRAITTVVSADAESALSTGGRIFADWHTKSDLIGDYLGG